VISATLAAGDICWGGGRARVFMGSFGELKLSSIILRKLRSG
jgi:hypothetical protein